MEINIMENETIKQVCDLFENNSIEKIAQMIFKIEDEERKKIEAVNNYAKSLNVTIQVKEDYTIGYAIKNILGFYISPSYSHDYKKVTAAKRELFLYWYEIRSAIGDYYNLRDIEINGNTIKTGKLDYDYGQALVKSYQNGNCIYSLTNELVEKIQLCKRIASIFDNH